MVELLVTMGLIAVVSAGVLSLIGRGPQQSGRDARRQADLQKIASALELYRSDRGGYPTDSCGGGGCLAPLYFATVPTDPTGGNYTYDGTGSCSALICQGFRLCANLEKTIPTCTSSPSEVWVTNP